MKVIQVGKEITFDVDDLTSSPPPAPQQKQPSPQESPKKIAKSAEVAGIPFFIGALLVLVTLLAGGTAVYFYAGQQEEIAARMKVESELGEVTAAKVKVEQKLEQMEQLRIDLEERVNLQKSNYEGALAMLQQQQDDYAALQKIVEANVFKITELRTALADERRESKKVGGKMIQLLASQKELKGQLEQVQMAKEALEQRVITLNKKNQSKNTAGVELGTIVVGAQEKKSEVLPVPEGVAYQPLPPPAKAEGQILVVNKEFAFVVVNIGQKDGIKDGTILTVFRGQQEVGKVEVERVYDTMSSAVILPGQTLEQLVEGDAVKLL